MVNLDWIRLSVHTKEYVTFASLGCTLTPHTHTHKCELMTIHNKQHSWDDCACMHDVYTHILYSFFLSCLPAWKGHVTHDGIQYDVYVAMPCMHACTMHCVCAWHGDNRYHIVFHPACLHSSLSVCTHACMQYLLIFIVLNIHMAHSHSHSMILHRIALHSMILHCIALHRIVSYRIGSMVGLINQRRIGNMCLLLRDAFL